MPEMQANTFEYGNEEIAELDHLRDEGLKAQLEEWNGSGDFLCQPLNAIADRFHQLGKGIPHIGE